MSRALDYVAKCAECNRMMRPGTLVDFDKDDEGYTYVHAGSCPSTEVAPRSTSQPRTVERDVYNCPHCRADWCFDKGAFARGRDKGIPGCPTCHKPWTTLYDDIQAGVFG